ncbi:hypothetical protein YC2023_119668 [Brassica napus]
MKRSWVHMPTLSSMWLPPKLGSANAERLKEPCATRDVPYGTRVLTRHLSLSLISLSRLIRFDSETSTTGIAAVSVASSPPPLTN